jgi:hypothetical protein
VACSVHHCYRLSSAGDDTHSSESVPPPPSPRPSARRPQLEWACVAVLAAPASPCPLGLQFSLPFLTLSHFALRCILAIELCVHGCLPSRVLAAFCFVLAACDGAPAPKHPRSCGFGRGRVLCNMQLRRKRAHPCCSRSQQTARAARKHSPLPLARTVAPTPRSRTTPQAAPKPGKASFATQSQTC